MGFKCLKKLLQNLVFSTLACLDVWVHPCVIALFNVVDFKSSILIYVDLLESLNANIGSELVHRSDYASNEFVEVNLIVSIYVKDLEKSSNIFLINLYSEVVDCLGELILIKGTRIVIVHDLKLPLQTDETARASCLQGRFEALYKDRLVARHNLGSLYDH
jgi:hypothetical protein